MNAFFSRAWSNLSWLLESLSSDSSRLLWSSLIWGRNESAGSAASDVTRLFFDLGVIHILVLSGSQVASFLRVHHFFLGLLLKFARVSRASGWARFGVALGWGLSALYVVSTGSSAPLVRAFIVQIVSASIQTKNLVLTLGLSFILHVLLFPEHWGGLSFVLSWGAFLLLVLMSKLNVSRLWGLVVLCVMCHGLVHFVKAGAGVSSFSWKSLLSNILWVPIFECMVFPLGSLLAWLVVLGSVLGMKWTGEGLLRQIFDSTLVLHEILAQVVLGGLEGIRYI